jgi:large subunit ribosomal protein L21
MEQTTMYAVFRTGGKQYRASEGERLKLEKLDADEGASIEFDQVLLVGDGSDIKVGSPLLSGTTVGATVLKQGRSGKVSVTKFRRRKNYLRRHTHRQWFTEVEITSIGGRSGTRKAKAELAAGDTEQQPATKETAPKKTSTKKVTKKASSKSSSRKTATKKTSKKSAKKKTAGKDEAGKD